MNMEKEVVFRAPVSDRFAEILTPEAVAFVAGLERRFGGGSDIFLSTTVLGELCFGAEKSSRVEDNFTKIRRLANLCPVLVCDEETARRYGLIKKLLQQKGRPIPENDIWIAALALQYDGILIT